MSPSAEHLLTSLRVDLWQADDQAWRRHPGMLPACPPAVELAAAGREAHGPLLAALRAERDDSLRFRNALVLLLYFDSLFVYRELKALYGTASEAQRQWLGEACRKLLVRCFHHASGRDPSRFRDIGKNTWRGRLGTTAAVVALAAETLAERGRKAVVRDMGVSDGGTSLDLAEAAAEQAVPLAIVATDRFLFLHFAERDGDRAVFASGGAPIQYELDGKARRAADAEPQPRLDALFRPGGLERITMLAPEVELAAESGRCDIAFKEEDVLRPEPDLAQADILRVANVLVEATADHRGYFTRDEIVRAIARLGTHAGDGARLVLDNFRRKIERGGLWRKDAAAGCWRRLHTPAGLPDVLDGIADIPIAP